MGPAEADPWAGLCDAAPHWPPAEQNEEASRASRLPQAGDWEWAGAAGGVPPLAGAQGFSVQLLREAGTGASAGRPSWLFSS